MKFTYSKGWFIAHKKPLMIWDEQFAEEQHASKKPYTVIVGEDHQHPDCFIIVNFSTQFIGVNFLDSNLAVFLEYRFTQQNDKFFLEQTFQRFYASDTEQILSTETHNFTPEGDLTIYQKNLSNNETITKKVTKPIDVSKNWEDIPEFGKYENFAKIER